jgi:RsiW-degrading membrane proteinase PrsW (M82 family)
MEIIVAILLAFIPALLLSWFIYWLDRYEKEPKLLLVSAFFWGGVVAVIGAFIGSTIMNVGFLLVLQEELVTNVASGSITAPFVEEFWKGLAVLIIFLLFRKEFDSIIDGIVYGAIVGLGFAATENVLYLLGTYWASGWEDMLIVFFLRVGVFTWAHPFATAFTGIGFAVARMSRNLPVKLLAPVAGYFIAILAHSFHNTAVTFAASLESIVLIILLEWLGWFIMFGFIIWMIRHEQGLLKKHLLEEVGEGRLSQAQYNTALSFFQIGTRLRALSSGRLMATSRFYQVCGELAHKKEQLAKIGDEGGNTAIIAKLRAELQKLAPQIG